MYGGGGGGGGEVGREYKLVSQSRKRERKRPDIGL